MRGTPLVKRAGLTYGAARFRDTSVDHHRTMLAQIRRFLNTKPARLFFVVLIVPFVMWGVADVARNFGSGTSLATVGAR